jgi:hypothetical protein
MYCFIIAGSAEKMAVGTARSLTGAPSGLVTIMNLQFRPLSFTISAPKNSPKRRAQVICDAHQENEEKNGVQKVRLSLTAVDFCEPYSAKEAVMFLLSPM